MGWALFTKRGKSASIELADGKQDAGVTPEALDRYRAAKQAAENKEDEKSDDEKQDDPPQPDQGK